MRWASTKLSGIAFGPINRAAGPEPGSLSAFAIHRSARPGTAAVTANVPKWMNLTLGRVRTPPCDLNKIGPLSREKAGQGPVLVGAGGTAPLVGQGLSQ